MVNHDLTVFERTIGPVLPSPLALKLPFSFGKLGMSLEGGGKRPFFAIGNYVKQRLLKPYHDWLMAVLKRIPNDGTFNQPEPLKYLLGHSHCYSYDLKSATDRWPLHFLYVIMIMLFGPSLASSVVNKTLGFHVFDVLFTKTKRSLCFSAGHWAITPLGLSSLYHIICWCGMRLSKSIRLSALLNMQY